MRRKLVSACLALALAASAGGARADEAPLVLAIDPRLGMEAGIRTIDSVGRVVFRYDEVTPKLVDIDESRFFGKLVGVLGRTAQVALFDEPIAEVEATVIHEVFGHGSRARNLGESGSFTFTLPGIYCLVLDDGDCTSSAQVTSGDGSVDRDLLVTTGGLEANFLTAYWIDLRVMRAQGRVHVGDLLVYMTSKLAYGGSFRSRELDEPSPPTGNDVFSYANQLQDRFDLYRAEDRYRISSRVRTASYWNLMDPMLMYSFYGVFYRAIGRGERWTTAPVPKVGDTSFYAAPRFNPSPFGPEHYLDLFLARKSAVLALYGRVGSSGLASYTGAGVRALGLRVHDRIELGAELDVWRQPETLLDDRAVYTRPNIWGANVGASIDVRAHRAIGVHARVAYKSDGYLVGQPIDAGLHGYFGVSIAMDRPTPP